MPIESLSKLCLAAESPTQKTILILHGRGDSAQGFAWIPEALRFKDVNYVIVNAPDPYEEGFSWYEKPPHALPGIRRSRQLLDQLLQELMAAGTPPDKLLVLGYSQGCLMTLEWASRLPFTLAGYVGISGYCHDPEAIIKELSPEARQGLWLITHGDEDERLPFHVTEQQMLYLQSQGFPIQFHRYAKPHKIDVWRELPMIRRWIRAALSLA